MMKNINEFFKKHKFVVIICFTLVIVTALAFISYKLIINKSSIKKIDEKNYSLKYDISWKIDQKEENKLSLKHSEGADIEINITKLSEEVAYLGIDELIDEIMYNISMQNTSYNLIYNGKENFTKDKYTGYKLLYENDDEQVMVNIYKVSDKLVTAKFVAKSDVFDILLDSVTNILYSFNVKEESFDLQEKIELETSNISFIENKEIDKLYNDTKDYEIANKHYMVNYKIPSIFEVYEIRSDTNTFSLRNDLGEIRVMVSVSNLNMYEYLSKDNKYNIYSEYSMYKEKEEYSDFKENLTKFKSDYDSYIYKNSYYYTKAAKYDENQTLQNYNKLYENAIIVYALDNNHYLEIKIKSEDVPITQKLINSIKINSSKNYSSYIKIEKEDGAIIGRLKQYSEISKKDKINYVTLRVPDKYVEVDKERNIYEERNYKLGYNEKLDISDFEVRYILSSSTVQSQIDTINSVYVTSNYGETNNLKYSGDIILNNKTFKVYDGGYTDLSGILLTNINRNKYYVTKKVLCYELPSKGCLCIDINGNDKKITDDVIKELVDFYYEQKDI